MKKIGLIGGITWQSTQLYYQLLNTKVAEKLGGQSSCECIIESVNFAEISSKQAEGFAFRKCRCRNYFDLR